jgi:hypothetical protein
MLNCLWSFFPGMCGQIWLNADGMAGRGMLGPSSHPDGEGTASASWEKFSLSYAHNSLWTGDPAYKFDAQINNSLVFASQSYTTMIQTAPFEFFITYNRYYHPGDGVTGCQTEDGLGRGQWLDGKTYGPPCSTAFAMKVTAAKRSESV